MSIADNGSCVRSRRWLRASGIERVVVASQKLGADGWMDGCRYRRSVKANGRRTRGRLARDEGYSDSATSDQSVGRRRRMWAATMDSDGEVRSDGEGVVNGRTSERGVVVVVVDARRGVGSSTVDGGLEVGQWESMRGTGSINCCVGRLLCTRQGTRWPARERVAVWRGAATHSRSRSARSCEWRVGTR